MKQAKMISLLLVALLAMTACTTPGAGAASSTLPSQSAAPVSEQMIEGTIVDAAMNTLQLKTDDGRTLLFLTEDADKSAAQGLLIDARVRVFYTGELKGDDASGVTVVRLEQDASPEQMIEGTIVDATMNTLQLKTDDGRVLLFSTEDAEKSAARGLLIDARVRVFYTGELKGDDASGMTVVRLEQDASSEQMVEGVVTEASMNVLSLTTTDGQELTVAYADADRSQVVALLLGSTLRVYYEGELVSGATTTATRVEQVLGEMEGVVLDASMNLVSIKTDDGKTCLFSTTDLEAGKVEGVALEQRVKISYAGAAIADGETVNLGVVSIAKA